MTKSSPAATDHWAVSARTHGAIVTAGVTLPSIEMALLGIPPGFTPAEIENWLHDLAGVAIETSRTDERERPIPPLLHHALTGLLFSQTELWSHTGHPLPCAAVFVHGPQGVAFGWTGRARVVLLVNGEPHEPQWVIVRDEAGQEAMSAAMPCSRSSTGRPTRRAPSLPHRWTPSTASRSPTLPPAGGPPRRPRDMARVRLRRRRQPRRHRRRSSRRRRRLPVRSLGRRRHESLLHPRSSCPCSSRGWPTIRPACAWKRARPSRDFRTPATPRLPRSPCRACRERTLPRARTRRAPASGG